LAFVSKEDQEMVKGLGEYEKVEGVPDGQFDVYVSRNSSNQPLVEAKLTEGSP
jgi:hypothetical protein